MHKKEVRVEVPVAAAAAGAIVATGISNDEVDELKRQIEDLKTQIASMEAGTVEEEKKVAEKLENDPDLLENYFALQMEVEELRRNEESFISAGNLTGGLFIQACEPT